jgi:hypothetical protein
VSLPGTPVRDVAEGISPRLAEGGAGCDRGCRLGRPRLPARRQDAQVRIVTDKDAGDALPLVGTARRTCSAGGGDESLPPGAVRHRPGD